MTILTGEQLFFRYAWPCADIRLARKEITEKQYRLLKFFRDNPHRQPGRRLLMECFPNAVRSLLETAATMRITDPWSLEHVAEYWRYHHEGPSPTELFEVELRSVDHILARINIRELFPLANPWSLEVEPGDRITAHNFHAIEKI
jgi:hypothetical protein